MHSASVLFSYTYHPTPRLFFSYLSLENLKCFQIAFRRTVWEAFALSFLYFLESSICFQCCRLNSTEHTHDGRCLSSSDLSINLRGSFIMWPITVLVYAHTFKAGAHAHLCPYTARFFNLTLTVPARQTKLPL